MPSLALCCRGSAWTCRNLPVPSRRWTLPDMDWGGSPRHHGTACDGGGTRACYAASLSPLNVAMVAPSPRSPLVTPGWFRRHSAGARRRTQTDVRLIEPLVEPLAKLRDRSGPSGHRPSAARPASHAVPVFPQWLSALPSSWKFPSRATALAPRPARPHATWQIRSSSFRRAGLPRRGETTQCATTRGTGCSQAAPMRLVAGKTPCTVRMHRRCRLQFMSARIVAGKTPCT